MSTQETAKSNKLGADGQACRPISSDQAQSLLRLFSGNVLENRGLGALLVATPNGKELYVTPRLAAGAY